MADGPLPADGHSCDGTAGKDGTPWIPFQSAPLFWGVLAVLVLLLHGMAFIRDIDAPADEYMDFFQDWVSARFFMDGLPVYGEQREASLRYLGRDWDKNRYFNVINGHPPGSALLVLPLGLLDFPTAVRVWNLLSLVLFLLSIWLAGRQLGIALSARVALPAVTLLLLCFPLREQFIQGQFNVILLALLVGCWAAERTGHPWLAGLLLATATGVKLLPALLFVYFAIRRRWDVVAAGLVGLAVFMALSVAILGLSAHVDFCTKVLPHVSGYRGAFTRPDGPPTGGSFLGFWARLFDEPDVVAPVYIRRLWVMPGLAKVGDWVCRLIVLALWAQAVLRARSRRDLDHAFCLTMTAMLLVSPVIWTHYYVLLLVPLLLIWRDLPAIPPARLAFVVVVLGLWMGRQLGDQYLLLVPQPKMAVPGGGEVDAIGPWQVLALVSIPLYALIGTFALGLWVARRCRGAGMLTGQAGSISQEPVSMG